MSNILCDIEPYYHYGFGEWVKSRKHYKELLRKHKCEEVGTEDIRSGKHKGMSERDIRETYNGRR